MRNPLQNVLTTVVAVTTLLPVAASAQVRTNTANRGPGGGQPWQCTPSDSLRAFNRGLRADSLARDRASGGQVPGTTPITGGTGRSHEYPEYDVVLDIPNLCVKRIFLKVDSVTAKLNLSTYQIARSDGFTSASYAAGYADGVGTLARQGPTPKSPRHNRRDFGPLLAVSQRTVAGGGD